jgi:hypothetical protein
MNRLKKIALVLFLVALLVLIRMYEDQLFYNVLLDFFKTNHSTAPLPDFELWKLIGNVSLRYFLNTLISLAILWVVFSGTICGEDFSYFVWDAFCCFNECVLGVDPCFGNRATLYFVLCETVFNSAPFLTYFMPGVLFSEK